MIKKMMATLLTVGLGVTTYATVITFNFEGTTGADLDGGTTASPTTSTTNGVTISAGATIGELNQTASGFGVNAPESTDSTFRFDAATNGVADVMIFSFDTAGTFTQLDLSAWSLGAAGDNGFLSFDGGSTFNFSDGLAANDILNISESFTAGQQITLSSSSTTSGGGSEGFGLTSITIDATVIPEPSSLALIMIGALVFVRRKFRQ